eukprot:364944_1
MSTDNENNCISVNDADIIKNCDHIQRLVHNLKHYETALHQNKLAEFFENDHPNLLDDYIHLISVHSGQFEMINKELMDSQSLKCDITPCPFTERRRGPQVENKANLNGEERYKFHQQTMDNVHYCFFHSFVLKRKILQQILDDEQDEKDDKLVDNDVLRRNKLTKEEIKDTDETVNASKFTIQTMKTAESDENTFLMKIEQYLKNHKIGPTEIAKFKQFVSEEGFDSDGVKYDLEEYAADREGYEMSKYTRISNIVNFVKDKNILYGMAQYIQNLKVSASSFSTGLIFYYWPYYQTLTDNTEYIENENNINDHGGYPVSELYVAPKYTTFKNEILSWYDEKKQQNYIFLSALNETILKKATKYIDAKRTKKMSAARCAHLHYGIKKGASLTINNLIAVILYCDYSDLCTHFSSTFRPKGSSESLKSIKLRNSEFWWLSRTLRETVQLFGNNRTKEKGPFYCGMNCIMYLYQFDIRLSGPNSTSTDKHKAIEFAAGKGILMQLNNNGDLYNSKRLRFFDCSWVSCFPEERERLFFGGDFKIRIESVITVTTADNFQKFFHALYLFDLMMNGNNMRGCKTRINSRDQKILTALIDNKLGIEKVKTYNDYVYNTFRLFCMKKSQIVLNINQLDWYFREQELFNLIFDEIMEDGTELLCPFERYQADKIKKWKETIQKKNLFNQRILQLFENAKTIIVYSTDKRGITSYSFVLNSLLSNINEYLSWNEIIIKAAWDEDDVHRYKNQRSWIYHSYNDFVTMLSKYGETGIKLSESTTNDGKYEDCLTIYRRDFNFDEIQVYYSIYLLDLMISKHNMTMPSITKEEKSILSHFISNQLQEETKTDTDSVDETNEDTLKPFHESKQKERQYAIFNTFCEKKTEVTINIARYNDTNWTKKKLYDLIMYDGLFTVKIFNLFPKMLKLNIELVSYDGRGSRRLSLEKLLSVLGSSSYSNSVSITAKRNSWISDLWNKQSTIIKEKFASNNWKISYCLVNIDSVKYPGWYDRLEISKNIW